MTTITGLISTMLVTRGEYNSAWKMFLYNQLFIILASIHFVLFFLKLPPVNSKWISFGKLSKHNLAAYYIHNSSVYAYYRNIPLKWAGIHFNFIAQIFFLIIYAFIIYITCSLIDVVVNQLLEKKINAASILLSKRSKIWLTDS